MAEVTLRPAAVLDEGASTWLDAGGAAIAASDVNDDSDTTYIEADASGDDALFSLDDLTLPSGAKIKQVRVRCRTSYQNSTDRTEFHLAVDDAITLPDFAALQTADFSIDGHPDAPITDFTGPWWAGDGSAPWTDSVIDALALRAFFATGTVDVGAGKELRHYELYVDVEYNERPVGALTAPTGTYTDDSSPDATWDYSDPEGDPQEAFRVVIEAGDQSANAAPALDGTEEYDSSKTFSSATTHGLPALPNGTYTVWLRVWQPDVSGQTQHSTWDAIVYTLDVQPPAVPTLTADADDPNGRITLIADSDSAAGEEAEEYDFEHSDDDGTTWEAVTGGAEVPPDSGTVDTPATVHDYEAPPNTARLYRARAARYDSGSGERLVSAWSSTAQATVVVDEWWLKDLTDPSGNLVLPDVIGPHETVEDETQGVFTPLGRDHKVVVSGDIYGEDGQLTIEFFDDDDYQAFRALRRTQRVLLLQSPFDEQWYIRLGSDLKATLVHGSFGYRFRRIQIGYVEVDRPT